MRRMSLWVAGVVLAIGISASGVRAGTLGTLPAGSGLDPLKDLTAGLSMNSYDPSAGTFSFIGVTDSGTFALTGTFDPVTHTAFGNLTASGYDTSGGPLVSYQSTDGLRYFDNSNVNQLKFLFDQTASGQSVPIGTDIYVVVAKNIGAADLSPGAVVPTPGAFAGGLVLMGLLGGLVARRHA